MNLQRGHYFLVALASCLLPLIAGSCQCNRPDLTGSIISPAQAYPGTELGKDLRITLRNIGTMPASGFHLDIVLSTDTSVVLRYATYSPNFTEDVLLGGGREYIDSLGAGKSYSVPLTGTDKIPGNTPPGKYFIGIVIDPADTIKEFAKGNNIAFAPIEILPCGTPADITGCQILGASGGTTGFASMDLGWSYGNGERPSQLLITVFRKVQGAWDNIMPSQQAFNVPSPATVTRDTVIIFRLFAGDYKIFMQTAYSCDQHKEFSFEQSLGREALRVKPQR